VLEVRDLHAGYGGVAAVRGVDLDVAAGEVVALVGPNGSGKTTLLRAITGLLRPMAGRVCLDGVRLDGAPAHDVVRRGVALVPEGRHVFPSMTVADNLAMGGYTRPRAEAAGAPEAVYALFPRLGERQGQRAGTLSGGEQQMLAIGRALMSRPRLLLLDEPSVGLAPAMVQVVLEALGRLRAAGTTVLLVEQNAAAALALADRGYVLELGRVTLHGSGPELLGDDRVRKAYLGED
jgi:branched-chain amino acid transport system ATP-binding protein